MTATSPTGVRGIRRRVAVSGTQELVSVSHRWHSVISVVAPTAPSVDLVHWVGTNRSRVEALLGERGAVLFRGFPVSDAEDFHAVVKSWSPELLNYTYGSTPRSRADVAGVYTSTEYPADQTIPQHNEMAYARIWPTHLWFYCHRAAVAGGATPLADSRRVAARLDRSLLDEFARRGCATCATTGPGST